MERRRLTAARAPVKSRRLVGVAAMALALLLLSSGAALAQRELHWANLDVDARVDADGRLHVTETHDMVFTGDWNGGERRFDIRPRQELSLVGISRITSGRRQPLIEDSRLDDVDDYTWIGTKTIRWRSRSPSDPPFASTRIRYELRYVLSGALLKDGEDYLLDHDFAFPNRDGTIDRFTLHLTFDPVWQPMSEVRDTYMATGLAPGVDFALKLPLRYSGVSTPATLDLTRPPEIVNAVTVLLGMTALTVLWFFVREQRLGRFAQITGGPIDEAWLREHILKYPAEVVGAAWDETIGAPEVVALIARMIAEGKLESDVGPAGSSMTLRLLVDRSSLDGYERTLVEGLFFDGRTETSTDLVKTHYRDEGFSPASAIRTELETSVEQVLPPGKAPRRFRWLSVVFFVAGFIMLAAGAVFGDIAPLAAFFVGLGTAVILVFAWIPGAIFRTQIAWGPKAALVCLIPTLTFAAGVVGFLWFYAGVGAVDLPASVTYAIAALTLGVTIFSIDALKSRQGRAAMAFRKRLAAGRAFFLAELRKEWPALRDEWYPWMLALELREQVDAWSTERPTQPSEPARVDRDLRESSSFVRPPERWTGFGGGRSGGAGGGASWAAAAGGMAAGVSAAASPNSSGDSSSSSGGSSGSSSSGGGGGGGW